MPEVNQADCKCNKSKSDFPAAPRLSLTDCLAIHEENRAASLKYHLNGRTYEKKLPYMIKDLGGPANDELMIVERTNCKDLSVNREIVFSVKRCTEPAIFSTVAYLPPKQKLLCNFQPTSTDFGYVDKGTYDVSIQHKGECDIYTVRLKHNFVGAIKISHCGRSKMILTHQFEATRDKPTLAPPHEEILTPIPLPPEELPAPLLLPPEPTYVPEPMPELRESNSNPQRTQPRQERSVLKASTVA